MNKSYRKWSVDNDAQKHIKQAIHLNFKDDKPIEFTFPFGGYKLWRLASYPEVDWAEFFTISYYSRYVSPILKVYKPGVNFTFSSDDVIIERMDNIPKEDTDAYFRSFQKLIFEFSKHYPDNMKMNITRVGDLYSQKEFENELAENVEKVKNHYINEGEERKKKMLKTSKLNIKFKGAEDWTKLSKEEQQAKIAMGPIYHDAHCSLSKRRDFVRGKNKVVLFTTPISNAIAIGTSKSSITKFWTGTGILEKRNGDYKDRILSPQQIKALEKLEKEALKIDLIPLKNFNKITIVKEKLNFSNKSK
ncbi:L-tyrosine/L-tryptophan isonitrile synthase family protein [Candidatus Dojkabacteria bacterium]|nr:L-tyrosine/L-tryptophan isonitrile synthase family protein [Candidatus Dojkabacteria bacterium]